MTPKLQPPDTHHLNAAQGWLELGNAAEALSELDRISPAQQPHPEVLETRWHIFAKTRDWQGCVDVGDQLVQILPKRSFGWIHRAYALHELDRTREAYDSLLPALTKFPGNWLIQYNLACYCCRLKYLDKARAFFDMACSLGDGRAVKAMALKDTDLRDIWDSI